MKQFLQNCSAVISREPKVFWEAVLATCSIKESGGRPVVVLRKPKVGTVKLTMLSRSKLSSVRPEEEVLLYLLNCSDHMPNCSQHACVRAVQDAVLMH